MAQAPTLRLADVRRPRETVALADGRVVALQPLNGIMVDLRVELRGGSVTHFWKLAAAVLPELTEAEVLALELEEVQAIVKAATEPYERVEALRKNSEGTAATDQG
jgi:hypothetical protein